MSIATRESYPTQQSTYLTEDRGHYTYQGLLPGAATASGNPLLKIRYELACGKRVVASTLRIKPRHVSLWRQGSSQRPDVLALPSAGKPVKANEVSLSYMCVDVTSL
jgi:hypothetical protein